MYSIKKEGVYKKCLKKRFTEQPLFYLYLIMAFIFETFSRAFSVNFIAKSLFVLILPERSNPCTHNPIRIINVYNYS